MNFLFLCGEVFFIPVRNNEGDLENSTTEIYKLNIIEDFNLHLHLKTPIIFSSINIWQLINRGQISPSDIILILNNQDLISEPNFEININLKSLWFHKHLNAADCYQKIDYFISNILVEEKKMEEVSDKVKIQQHGFDKHSFRKTKNKK